MSEKRAMPRGHLLSVSVTHVAGGLEGRISLNEKFAHTATESERARVFRAAAALVQAGDAQLVAPAPGEPPYLVLSSWPI